MEEAQATALPVDIIWMVDNSSSMQPAIAQIKQGLNSFAALIESKSLDYQVIMLSLRNAQSPVSIGGSNRYPVCIHSSSRATPTAATARASFNRASISAAPSLSSSSFGTLGQTKGYTASDDKGGEAWAQHLRLAATKTIVVVTDDNARLSVTDFETFPGGKNPFNSNMLPAGILDPSWNGLFTDYTFSGIYGFGNLQDPSVKCKFPT